MIILARLVRRLGRAVVYWYFIGGPYSFEYERSGDGWRGDRRVEDGTEVRGCLRTRATPRSESVLWNVLYHFFISAVLLTTMLSTIPNAQEILDDTGQYE